MQITKNQTDNLNLSITVALSPEDYLPVAEKALKNYAHKVSMPGFRPGKVPTGMVRKMYGKSILLEEVNRMLGDSLNNYIEENGLRLLGNPLPSETVAPKVDFDNPDVMEFTFDLGLSPEVNVELSKSRRFTRYVITPSDADVDSALENMARRNGEMTAPETSAEGDIIKGLWVEMDGSEPRVGGVMHASSVNISDIPDPTTRSQFVGIKVGDVIVVDHTAVTDSDIDRAAMLNVSREQLADLNPMFRFTVERIQRLIPAELNADLFAKLYPDGSVTDEEGMKEKIREDYRNYFEGVSDRRLHNEIADAIIREQNIALPDEFLKRWMLTQHDHDHATHHHTQDEIDREYAQMAGGLRWQLVENDIIRQKGLTLTLDEVKEGVKEHLRAQFAQYGIHQANDDMMGDMVNRFMKREDEVRRVSEELMNRKVLAVFKESFSFDDKVVSADEFSGR
jgi:trigger factor